MTRARQLLSARGIDLRVAYDAGVRLGDDGESLRFPTGKLRRLNGTEPKFVHPKGQPLSIWWLQKSAMRTVLLCEGETDALAALSALRATPEVFGLRELPVASVPGAAYPAHRLVGELRGLHSALLAFDPDPAGYRASGKHSAALLEANIRPVPIRLPEGTDLAGWLAGMEEEQRGEALASLLVDSEADAPRLDQLQALRKAAALRAEADRLEVEAA